MSATPPLADEPPIKRQKFFTENMFTTSPIRDFIADQESHYAVYPPETKSFLPLRSFPIHPSHPLRALWKSENVEGGWEAQFRFQRNVFNIVLDGGLIVKEGQEICLRLLRDGREMEACFGLDVHGPRQEYGEAARRVYEFIQKEVGVELDFIVEIVDRSRMMDYGMRCLDASMCPRVMRELEDRALELAGQWLRSPLIKYAEDGVRELTGVKTRVCFMRRACTGAAGRGEKEREADEGLVLTVSLAVGVGIVSGFREVVEGMEEAMGRLMEDQGTEVQFRIVEKFQ